LVVSASINWGKRCPHFLAQTRPPFFATSLRANGKNGHAREERKKKHVFFAAAPLVVRSPKKKPHRLSAFACEESDDEKRKARDGQRRRARRRTRFFFTRIRAFARKIARFAEKPPFAAAVAGILRGARRLPRRRVAGALRAERPTARAFTLLKTPSTPKHTRSEDCFGTSLLHQPKSRSELG
jgi:hypothetical protein